MPVGVQNLEEIPVLICRGKTVLRNPSNAEAAACLGFNPAIELTRTQTIMEGAPFCDFRFRLATSSDSRSQAEEKSTGQPDVSLSRPGEPGP